MQLLKFSAYDDEKMLIVISSCLTWLKCAQRPDEVWDEKDAVNRRGFGKFELLRFALKVEPWRTRSSTTRSPACSRTWCVPATSTGRARASSTACSDRPSPMSFQEYFPNSGLLLRHWEQRAADAARERPRALRAARDSAAAERALPDRRRRGRVHVAAAGRARGSQPGRRRSERAQSQARAAEGGLRSAEIGHALQVQSFSEPRSIRFHFNSGL